MVAAPCARSQNDLEVLLSSGRGHGLMRAGPASPAYRLGSRTVLGPNTVSLPVTLLSGNCTWHAVGWTRRKPWLCSRSADSAKRRVALLRRAERAGTDEA